MTAALVTAAVKGPHIDWVGLSPFMTLIGGAVVVLLLGLFSSRFVRTELVPALALVAIGGAIGLAIGLLGRNTSIISGALAIDDLALVIDLVLLVTGIAAVLLSLRSRAAEEAGHGEFYALLLFSLLGMMVLVSSQNLVTLFLGFELLSIPLYVMCATEMHREGSLEAGLKYLVVGSVGSATLLYGLALLYGATGSTDLSGIARAVNGAGGVKDDALLLTGIAMTTVGLAFKASVAPFHQWTPDVYEGAPTPVTAFMAVATKAAAFGVLLRLFDVALIGAHHDWAPALAALATITIIVGNVGALGQTSLKRMLGYSGVAQAGYLLCGVIVGTQLGIKATVFYLVVYLAMNIAAFATIVARERETPLGDDLEGFAGLGRRRPQLAIPLTVAMLGLAGIPATAGFIGKFYLIDALVDGGYAWLAIVLVLGSMISLGYYLRVVATLWMREEPVVTAVPPSLVPAAAEGKPLMAGGSQEADRVEPRAQPEVLVVAWVCTAAVIVLGIIPSPLFRLAGEAGKALVGLR
ncbi:MAG: proton-translocating NADH-quinone oxidoreductase, chain [Conexibacter sp.]|nr:proton-translocating NADH-quinone oxidoreductase, chain [Conexibacter sp.]